MPPMSVERASTSTMIGNSQNPLRRSAVWIGSRWICGQSASAASSISPFRLRFARFQLSSLSSSLRPIADCISVILKLNPTQL